MTAWMLLEHHSIPGGRGSGSIGICGIRPQWSHWCKICRFGLVEGCCCGSLVQYPGGGLTTGIGGLAGRDSVGLC